MLFKETENTYFQIGISSSKLKVFEKIKEFLE